MTDSTSDDPLVADPTWSGNPAPGGNIQDFFDAGEIACMNAQGIDLSSYSSVRGHSTDIYEQTKSGNMPMGGTPWSANRVQTFLNWINTGFPMGSETPQPGPAPTPDAPGARYRKNVNSLEAPEIELLKKAFRGIMALDPGATGPVDPNSYFGLAAVHGLPQAYCMHHVDTYNPWHRVYVTRFEDALRSIEGCENVTLPYWDIKTPVPALVYEEPFASYTLPRGIGDDSDYPQGYVTQRYDPDTIWQNLQQAPTVASQIDEAMPATSYGGFQTGGYQQPIMGAHDDGHVSCGNTMADQDVASYDPIFWFFHCNWERLFWSWQVNAGATNVPGFTATVADGTEWMPLELDPYPDSTEDVIPYPQVTYEELDTGAAPLLANKAGHVLATRAFTIEPSTPVSVRVKDIDRMNIPGSFIVRLLADGEPIARRAFFQPRSPRTCKTCRTRQLISLDFHLPQEEIQGRTLSIAIEVPTMGEGEAGRFPLESAGNPTINARLLLKEA